jgi:hypothetical protein
VFVQGGKRLSFDRRDEYTGALTDTFAGSGKSEGAQPSCSWEELCALAQLVVDHPAFRLPPPTDYYPPTIQDEESRGQTDEEAR